MPPFSSLSRRVDEALQRDIATLGDEDVEVLCSISPDQADELFRILERNMRDMYAASEWGWDGDSKRAELSEKSARFVVARNQGKILGFGHFRFEVDDDDAPERVVLYVREVQCAERRRGAGKKCMEKMEQIAAFANVDAVLLTVFKSNVGAVQFYEKIGYVTDGDDPGLWGHDSCFYRILSKDVRVRRRKRKKPRLLFT